MPDISRPKGPSYPGAAKLSCPALKLGAATFDQATQTQHQNMVPLSGPGKEVLL